MSSPNNVLLGLAVLAASLSVGAQPAPAPNSSGTGGAYNSAFDGYRPFEAGDVQDWRRTNDTARDIGGWRTYAREMRAPQGATPSPQTQGDASGTPPRAATSPDQVQPGSTERTPANPHEGHQR